MSEITNSEGSSVDRFFSADEHGDFLAAADRKMVNTFEHQKFKDLEGLERNKTAAEIEIIGLANDSINDLRAGFDLSPFTVPEDNIHVVSPEVWPPIFGNANGVTGVEKQSMLIKGQRTNIGTALTIYHEMLHLASYTSIEVTPKNLMLYRQGLQVKPRPVKANEPFAFTPLNEAVTEELSRRFIADRKQLPIFEPEIRETKNLLRLRSERGMPGLPFSLEDIACAYLEKEGDEAYINYDKLTEIDSRAALQSLCIDLGLRYGLDQETVFHNFVRSFFDGNLLTLGKVIDTAYGRGTFRHLGEQGTEAGLLALVNSLTAKSVVK